MTSKNEGSVNNELIKSIKAEYGVDVSPLFKDVDIVMNAIPQYSKDRASSRLEDILKEAKKRRQPVEETIIRNIYTMSYSRYVREQRLALLVLLTAKAKKLISTERYIEVRKRLGYQDENEELGSMLEKERAVGRDDFAKIQ